MAEPQKSLLDQEMLPPPEIPRGAIPPTGPGVADPQDIPQRVDARPPQPPQDDYTGPTIQAYEPTGLQKVIDFFIGKPSERPIIDPQAGLGSPENPIRAWGAQAGRSAVWTAYKASKGLMLDAPDLLWAGLTRVVPDEYLAEWARDKPLDEVVLEAMRYDPAGMTEMIGETAGFVGRLRTAGGILKGIRGAGPTAAGVGQKVLEAAEMGATAGAIGEGVKAGSAVLQPGATAEDYGYQGGQTILKDAAIMAAFELLSIGGGAAWKALKGTEKSRALKMLGLKKGATEEEIKEAARKMAKKTLGLPETATNAQAWDAAQVALKQGLASGQPQAHPVLQEMQRIHNSRQYLLDLAKKDIVTRRAQFAKGLPGEAPKPPKAKARKPKRPPKASTPATPEPGPAPAAPAPLATGGEPSPGQARAMEKALAKSKLGPSEGVPAPSAVLTRIARQQTRGFRAVPNLYDYTFTSASERLRPLGDSGAMLADDLQRISWRSIEWSNKIIDDAKQHFRGLSSRQRKLVAMGLDGEVPLDQLPPKLRRRVIALRPIMDRPIDWFIRMGGMRRVGGEWRPATKSGHAFPQVLTDEARAKLEKLASGNITHPDSFEFLEAFIPLNPGLKPNDIAARLIHWRDNNMRPISPNLEESRLHIPAKYREWDPNKVLPQMWRRQAPLLAAWETWGYKEGYLRFPTMETHLEAILAQYPEAKGTIDEVREWAANTFGLPVHKVQALADASEAIRYYNYVSKYATNPLSALKNMLDRIPAALRVGDMGSVVTGLIHAPPFFRLGAPSSRALYRELNRRGIVIPHTAMSVDAREGGLVTTAINLMPHLTETGNEQLVGIVRAAQLNRDLAALRKYYETDVGAWEQTIYRAIQPLLQVAGRSRALREQRVLQMKRGDRSGQGLLSDEEWLNQVMQKELEHPKARTDPLAYLGDPQELLKRVTNRGIVDEDTYNAFLHRIVADNTFAMTIARQPVWWHTNFSLRTFGQYKTWPLGNAYILWRDVIKYTAKTGDVSRLIRTVVGFFIAGEMYNIAADYLLNRNESILRGLRTDVGGKEIARRVAKDIVEGGLLSAVELLSYGFIDALGGPFLSNLKNLGAAARHLVAEPKQAPDVVKDLARREVVPLRHGEAILKRFEAKFGDRNDLTPDFYRLAHKAALWARTKKGENVKYWVDRVTMGFPEWKPADTTLQMDMARRALVAGDIDEAAGHLVKAMRWQREDILAQEGTGGDISDAFRRMESDLINSGPLGPVKKEWHDEFEASLSQSDRAALNDVMTRWTTHVGKAMARASASLEKELGLKDKEQQ